MQVENKVLKVGVVGYGYWSPKVINGFNNVKGAEVFAICEKDKNKHDSIRTQIPNVKIYLHFQELIDDSQIDAIVVTTTVSSHYRIGKATLMAGKHLLLEKPMTEEVWQAENLINIAQKKKKILMVDHTFLFMPSIKALKRIIDSGELGYVHSVVGTRANLGLFQKDTDVVYDLAPHDFSIMYYLFNEIPQNVVTSGTAPIVHKYHKRSFNSISNVTLNYKSGRFVNLLYSWLTPIKDRRMIFVGDKKMCVFDMLDKEGVLKIYDTKVEVINDAGPYGSWFNYQNGEYRVVDIEKQEGDDLQRMAQEFVDSINEKRQPITDGNLGKIVVQTLKKVENVGKPIIPRYFGNFKDNLRRIINGNYILK